MPFALRDTAGPRRLARPGGTVNAAAAALGPLPAGEAIPPFFTPGEQPI